MPLVKKITIKDFAFGQIDSLEDTSLPRGAASRSLNFLTKTDRIELRPGSKVYGDKNTGVGKITGQYTAKLANGTKVKYRTHGKKLEYYVVSTDTWTEIGTDALGADADGKDMSFAEYHSLAGDQLFICSPYGPLLKIMLANPASYTNMYDAVKNYYGYIKIKQNRMFLWGRLKDKTSPYLSFIDEMNYTEISAEVIGTGNSSNKTFTETLDFKAAGAKRTCFAIEVTDGVEIFTDNNDGTLTGDKGGTGTINYTTGAISVTFKTAPAVVNITCTYQWENSTDGGICDFTYSATRLAGEGATFRQDDGGNLISIESYGEDEYCIHENKTWVLTLTADDTNALNVIYREKVGLSSLRGAVSTADGIYYIDDSDKANPQIRLLTIPYGMDKVIPESVSKNKLYKKNLVGIDLTPYLFDKACGAEWEDYIIFAFRTEDSTQNNKVLLYHKKQKSIDILDYWVSVFDVDGGDLMAGDPVSNNTFQLFTDYSDDSADIANYWEGNKDDLDWLGEKKLKKLIIKGKIGVDQQIKISIYLDDADAIELGTISGASEVIMSGNAIIGRTSIGVNKIGGEEGGLLYSDFISEINVANIIGRFNDLKLRIEATALGVASISEIIYKDIRWKNQKLIARFR